MAQCSLLTLIIYFGNNVVVRGPNVSGSGEDGLGGLEGFLSHRGETLTSATRKLRRNFHLQLWLSLPCLMALTCHCPGLRKVSSLFFFFVFEENEENGWKNI